MKNKRIFLSDDVLREEWDCSIINKTDSCASSYPLPTLYRDLVFIEANSPILFTCTDDNYNTYIITHHTFNKWLISLCPISKIIAMLSDKITIRECVENENTCYWELEIFENTNGKNEANILILTNDKASQLNYLPTARYYMGVDNGEFDEEIAILKKRIRITSVLKGNF